MDMVREAIAVMLSGGSDKWVMAFCRIPGLMAEEILDAMQEQALEMPPKIQEGVDAFRKVARNIEKQMRTDPAGYPFGAGPLEAIHQRLKQGEIGIEVAKMQARELVDQKVLHLAYLRVLSHRCVSLSYQGRPEEALNIQTLILEAARCMLDDTQHADSTKLCAEFIRSASWHLYEQGNVKCFRDALAAGEFGLQRARTDEERSELRLVLGLLYLDPYAANRSRDWYRIGIHQWFAAGQNPEEYFLGQNDSLPFPQDALALAETHLRSAAGMARGANRRDALKALVQTLESGRNIGRMPDDRELVALCDQALEAFSKWPDQDNENYIRCVREKLIRNIDPSSNDISEIPLPESLQDLIDRMGPDAAVDGWVSNLNLLLRKSPASLLEAIIAQRSIFMRHASDSLKEALWRLELAAISALGDEQSSGDTIAADQRSFCRALCIALQAKDNGDEQAAREKLVTATKDFAERYETHYDAIRWLYATLEMNLGADAYRAQDFFDAARHYGLALQMYADLEFGKFSAEMLGRLQDIIVQADVDVLDSVTATLINIGAQLDCLMEPVVLQPLDSLSKTLIKRYAGTHAKKKAWIWAMEFAKGRIFRAFLRSSGSGRFVPSAHALQLVQAIQVSEDLCPVPDTDEKGVVPETLLGSFYTESVPTAGKDSDSRLRNLRLTFDKTVTRERLLNLGKQPEKVIQEDDFVKKLPDTTVLIDMFIAGRIGVNLVFTSEGGEGFAVDNRSELAGARVRMSDETFSVSMDTTATIVEIMRRNICAEPGPFEVDRKAREMLDSMLLRLLGHGSDRLQAWWDMGKRHLCFVPHGPLHFLPIHLLTWKGKPLADQWTITYLPNTALLTEANGPIGTRTDRALSGAALGLRYDGHPFLQPIENSISETTAVAQAMGVSPEVDGSVTKDRVKKVFTSCSHIHLSCHGHLHPEAPELQHLYLASQKKSGEKLYAFEFSALDLSHVEMVSLSACQSGLGRFDHGDNLRGIQADLFLSGVQTIVDTLWDVSAAASETFFSSFYRQLFRDRSILSAFRKAQVETRKSHRAYRDWGAFRLSGLW